MERDNPPPSAHGGPRCQGAITIPLAGSSREALLAVVQVLAAASYNEYSSDRDKGMVMWPLLLSKQQRQLQGGLLDSAFPFTSESGSLA